MFSHDTAYSTEGSQRMISGLGHSESKSDSLTHDVPEQMLHEQLNIIFIYVGTVGPPD